MCDVMTFPETVNGFFEQYGIWDREEVYTNGALLIPVFRVEQMIDHYFRERTCHNDHGHCDKCGSLLVLKGNYCFNCGSKVVDE